MDSLLSKMESDTQATASAVETVQQEGLASVASLARAVKIQEDEVQSLEEALIKLDKRLEEIKKKVA